MRFPVDQPFAITTHFNAQTHPGIDIAPLPGGIAGIIAHAPERGTVVASGTGVIEGNYVIMHGQTGMFYYFGHFAKRLVISGQPVNEGDVLGVIGMTGAATGIHTHNEVRPQQGPGNQVDPEQWYKQHEEGDDMIIDDALARRLLTLSTLLAQDGNAPDRQPTTQEIQDAVGRDAVAYCDYLMSTVPWGNNWNKVKHYNEDVANTGGFEKLPFDVYKKK